MAVENLPAVAGLPLEEALARLAGLPVTLHLKRTGEVGRARVACHRERRGLAECGERVVRVRREQGGVELVVAAAFGRAFS
jgi:hypothetical protein